MFVIFDPTHILWVPTIYVLSNNIKNIKIILVKFLSVFSAENISVCILHGRVFVMVGRRS